MEQAFHIAIPTNALQLAIGETTKLADGTPVRRIKRFGIQAGQRYVKKLKDGTKQIIDATAERCNHWLAMGQELLRNGVSPRATFDHADWRLAKNVRGDVVDLAIEDGWLALTMDIRGEENIRIAEACKDVSIEGVPEFTDGKGRKYEDVLMAITFTGNPVVDSQPIAASLEDENRNFELSQERDMTKFQEALAKLSGKKAEEVTEANACELVDAHLALCNTTNTKLSQLEATVLKLSHEPDPKYLSLATRAAEAPLDNLKASGVLDVATCEGLKKLVLGEKKAEGGRNFSSITLSLGEEDGEAIINFTEKLAAILSANKPVKTGETTPGQELKLAREVPDGDGTPKTKKIVSPWTGKEVEVNV